MKCMCKGCMNNGTVKVERVIRFGGRSGYICDFHSWWLANYSADNDTWIGTDKVTPFTFGSEFETSRSTATARAEMYLNSYMPSRDSTVDVEYKSPVYRGLNAFSKHMTTFDRLIREGEMEVGDNCGTHTHVGHLQLINATTIDYVRRYYHSLFLPLSREMESHPYENIRLFGRDFGEWACPINERTSPWEHTNFINLQHDVSFEWRINKFVTYEQYMKATKCVRDMTEAVVNNFIAHFTDHVAGDLQGDKEYRKHKANIAAQKMVKIYKKYAGIKSPHWAPGE